MNTDLFPTDPAEEQASLWAARLEGASLSAADRDQLDLWLNADPAHRALLATYCQFSADLEEQLPLLVATGLDSLSTEFGEEQKPKARPYWWLASGGLAAAAAVAVVLLVTRAHATRIAATAAGQRQTITLDDGTTVELNARTTLTFENTPSSRHVQLAEGEAYFAVAKDPRRPFVVETPAGSVRVVGTVFDVRSESTADLAVTVVEGSVQVRPGQAPAEAYLLKHNDALTAGSGPVKVASLSADQLGDALAWRDGLVIADGQPLQEAIARFARYHGRGITVTPAAGRITIGGRYNLDDLESFLADIQQYPVRVTHEANGTIRVSLRGEP